MHRLFPLERDAENSYLALPPDDDSSGGSDRVAKEAGFSLNARVSTEAHQRDKPAFSEALITKYIWALLVTQPRSSRRANG